MKELAYLNGTFGPVEEAMVSIEDRGYQFGDGVYEVIAVYDGRPFLLDEHMTRLRTSLGAIQLDYDFDSHPLEPIILEGLERAEADGQAMIYVQISRGTQPRSHVYRDDLTPNVVLTFKPLHSLPEEMRRRGASLKTAEDIRWDKCFIKAITLLPNIMIKNEAIRSGFDDAIFVTSTGSVRECTSANIFMVKDGAIITPERTENVLHGITQAFLMKCAESIDLPVRENGFDVPTMLQADEVFMSSTTIEVLGVTKVDGQVIADGNVGPITQRMHQAYADWARRLSQDPNAMAC
ncbi:MAG: aminotransferase class IV [Phycisphaerae bacterium]